MGEQLIDCSIVIYFTITTVCCEWSWLKVAPPPPLLSLFVDRGALPRRRDSDGGVVGWVLISLYAISN